MQTYVIYAEWSVDRPVDAALLAAVNKAWEVDDETFCSAPDNARSDVLSLSFDIAAETDDDASTSAVARVQGFGRRVGLPGQLTSLRGYTEEGWFETLVA